MNTVHLSVILPLINPRFFKISSLRNKLLDLTVLSVGDSIEKGVLHLFDCVFLLHNPELFPGKNLLVEGMGDVQFVFDGLEAVDERVKEELLPAFLSLPHNSVEYLASSQSLKDDGLLDADLFEKQQIFMISFADFNCKCMFDDVIFKHFQFVVDGRS